MFKTILFAVCALATHEALAQLSGTTYADAQKSKSAAWTFTYTETPSFASKQADGSIQGLAVEIMKKFADYVQKTEGIKATYEFKGKDPADFKGFLDEVKAAKGGVFGLGNITITE